MKLEGSVVTTKDNGFRYWRWRFAMKRPQWAIDRHWYVLMGYLGESLRLVLHYYDVMSSYPKAMLTIDSLDPKVGSGVPKGAYGRQGYFHGRTEVFEYPNPRFDPAFLYRELGAEAMRRFRSKGQA